jgi:hypothetical protein
MKSILRAAVAALSIATGVPTDLPGGKGTIEMKRARLT